MFEMKSNASLNIECFLLTLNILQEHAYGQLIKVQLSFTYYSPIKCDKFKVNGLKFIHYIGFYKRDGK